MNFDSNVRDISVGYPVKSEDGKSLNLINKLMKELDSLPENYAFNSEELYRRKLFICNQLGHEFYDRKGYPEAKL